MAIQPTATLTQTKQEFLNSVLNKIGKQEFSNTVYKNPLTRIIGEFIEGATDIEEIYVERSTDVGYDPSGANVLDRTKPTTFVQYHTNTVDHGYDATIQNKQMRKGFTTKSALSTMANTILNQLHTGKEVDEYTDCLNTLKALVSSPQGEKDNIISVKPIADETSSKAFVKAIKKTIPKMTEYSNVFSDKTNYAKSSDLILFIDSDVEVETEVEWLAGAFNLSVAQLNETTKMVIPNLKSKIGAIGVLCHHKCLKINPTYYDIDSIKNTKGKFINYHLVTETLLSYTTWYPYAIIKDDLV
ncbi:hypothetical protein [Romboutsia sp.]|uniref:hypothetical protein n=1 Tax=Romboutsia sp. TaxID=1965302 RepID=UPI003F322716